jgi:hypothetical protein
MATIDYGWDPCPTCAILECVDSIEYAALVDAAKDGLRIILMCGAVNMCAGSNIRTWLFQIFPSGKTHNALVAKFSQTVTS